MATKTILVVDPDATVGELLASILGEENYRVATAQSLGEAAALLTSSEFDLIITEAFDQHDKFEFDSAFLSELASPTRSTPIVLCSTYASVSTLRSNDLGLADVVAKPFDIDDLLNKVNRLLGNSGPAFNGTHKGSHGQAAA